MIHKPESRKPQLTVLSFGGGQDSTAILYMLATNSVFRKLYAPHDLIVIMSDTGNEHPETYMHIRSVQKFCDDHGIIFILITSDLGFHNKNWQSLQGYFKKYNSVMSRAFKKSCTDNLKIQPIYKFLNAWISMTYDLPIRGGVYHGKRALVEFAQKYGKIRVLLGIAKGEESRISQDGEEVNRWMEIALEKAYPLMWLGWDREACQDFIRKIGQIVPPPSNCMFCPFMALQELLWMARKYPESFEEWCGYERRKLRKFKHLGDNNVCVLHKTKTLRQILADAERKYGHLTLAELEEYRFSHGHCVRSKY